MNKNKHFYSSGNSWFRKNYQKIFDYWFFLKNNYLNKCERKFYHQLDILYPIFISLGSNLWNILKEPISFGAWNTLYIFHVGYPYSNPQYTHSHSGNWVQQYHGPKSSWSSLLCNRHRQKRKFLHPPFCLVSSLRHRILQYPRNSTPFHPFVFFAFLSYYKKCPDTLHRYITSWQCANS